MSEPLVSTYRQALDAKLSNRRFMESTYAEDVIRVSMVQIVGEHSADLPTLILLWRILARYINLIGTPYYFSGDVCQLVAAGATALDEDYRLQAEDLPGPAGHFHYAHTLQTERNETDDAGTITTRLVGASWATYGFGLDPVDATTDRGKTIAENVGIAPDKAEGIVIVTWSLADEFRTRPYGLPLSMHCWKFGDTAAEVYNGQDAVSENLAAIRDHIVHNPDYTECSILAASMLFLQQTIVQVTTGDIPSVMRKQAKRDDQEKELVRPQVVHLRRRKTIKENGSDDEAHLDEAHFNEREKIEWSHRWLVDGHWRNQPYTTLGVIKRIWISGFVKGPENKPLRTKPIKIAAVVR